MRRLRSKAAGFTLLELLVAMTVLGVLTGLLATGLSFGARIWEREQKQLEQWAELQTVQDVIRRTLGQAWPLTVRTASGTPGAGFVGKSTSIEFFGPPPAQSLAGGVYRYGLLSRNGPGGVSLVLTWRLRSPDGTQRKAKRGRSTLMRREESGEDKEIILVDRLVNAEFSYLGAEEDGPKPRWRDRWLEAEKLPLLVRMHVEFPPGDRRKWPDLVIAPAITGSPNEG
jgi:general secretion pathway protein J